MERYSLRDAQAHLGELIAEAQQGKTVLIVDEKNNQAVQLIPVAAVPKRRKAGSAKGLIYITTDFDTPLAGFDEYME